MVNNYGFKMMKNKKAWIRIVEAFIAILLIIGAVLVIIDKGYIQKEDISLKVYEREVAILKEIELNNTFRGYILSVEDVPVNWSDFESRGLGDVKDKINSRTPDYLICEAKICDIGVICNLDESPNKDVYARSVMISTDLEQYKPRQLKLFCWVKEE